MPYECPSLSRGRWVPRGKGALAQAVTQAGNLGACPDFLPTKSRSHLPGSRSHPASLPVKPPEFAVDKCPAPAGTGARHTPQDSPPSTPAPHPRPPPCFPNLPGRFPSRPLPWLLPLPGTLSPRPKHGSDPLVSLASCLTSSSALTSIW